MAKNDVRIVDAGGANVTPVRTFKTEAAGTAIKVGEPVKIGGTGSNYVVPLATGDPEIGTDRMVGIAASASTQTASADGVVDVYIPIPGVTVMRAKATTAANVDTDAEILALLNDSVTFDLASGVYTIDEDEGDDIDVHGLLIVGGNADEKTLDVVLKSGASLSGEIAV
jgi:hypothetical protein